MTINPAIPRCAARTRQDGSPPCRLPAGSGTDHPGTGRCRFHGGKTRSHRVSAARTIGRRLAEPLQVDPLEALRDAVWAWNGVVAYFTAEVAELEASQIVIEHRRERAVADGDSYVETSTDVRLNILVRERHEALKELARAAKTAIDAGVQEREISLAERLGGRLGDAIGLLLDRLELSDDQRDRAPAAIRAALHVVDGGTRAAA